MPKIHAFESIPESGFLALESLALYHYLTPSHFQALGVSSTTKKIRERVLSRLLSTSRPLIQSVEFPPLPGKGNLERFYCLTRFGAQEVADYWKCPVEDITFPIGGLQFTRDYFHRKAFVHTHISLRKWLSLQGYELDFFDSYFQKSGAQRSEQKLRAKTQISYGPEAKGSLIPDGVFRFRTPEKSRLCVLEIHRGVDSGRITQQLNQHINALSLGAVAEHYDHPNANFVLSLHENQSTLDSTRRRLLALPDFAAFLPLFAFNLIDTVQADFGAGWITAEGHPSPLFSRPE